MTTAATSVPAELIVDFDVYDPALAAPVDVMREKIAEFANKKRLLEESLEKIQRLR